MKLRRSNTSFGPVSKVRPGQRFTHFGQEYRRATEEEVRRHPGRENRRYVEKGDLVLAYGLGDQPIPVTFVEDTWVVAKTEKRKEK